MFAYQYDLDGYLVGPVEADPHPLRPLEYLLPGRCTFTVPPTVPAGKRARWVSNAWTLVTAPPSVPAPPPLTAEDLLNLQRESWQPYARAFFKALTYFPFPTFLHMLDAYSQTVAALGPYDDLKIWDQRVTIVLRAHPDMEAFRLAFSLTPEQLDLIFIVAVMIEAGEDEANVIATAEGGTP